MVDADGTVHLVGRGATCINTGGEKVYPEEVEAVLLTHPRVRDAIVVGVPDERYGAAVAAVVACDGEPVELDELRAHCRASLAGYKLPRPAHRRRRGAALAGRASPTTPGPRASPPARDRRRRRGPGVRCPRRAACCRRRP